MHFEETSCILILYCFTLHTSHLQKKEDEKHKGANIVCEETKEFRCQSTLRALNNLWQTPEASGQQNIKKKDLETSRNSEKLKCADYGTQSTNKIITLTTRQHEFHDFLIVFHHLGCFDCTN